jgi:RHS repeat-associated protein
VYDDTGALLTDGTRSFAYDALGRLTGVSGGGHTAAYLLDGDGQRVSQTIDSVTTLLDLDLRGELSSVLVAGDTAYLPGMASLGSSDGTDWTATLADAQGSVLATVDAAGTMGPVARYDPYGGPRPSTTLPVGIGFTGEWTDPVGLVDLRARVYDPSLQGFLTRDTFGGIPTIPAYSFVPMPTDHLCTTRRRARLPGWHRPRSTSAPRRMSRCISRSGPVCVR